MTTCTITRYSGYHSLDADGYELNLLARTRDETIGRLRFVDCLSPANRELCEDAFARLPESGRLDDLECEIIGWQSIVPWVLLSATAISDQAGRYVSSRATLIDIGPRKRAEAQVQALNAALALHARRLETANGELLAFSYSVSHDLRAPLRSLDGFSLALLEDYGAQLDERAHDFLNRIRGAAQRMAEMIDALLLLSRVTQAALRIERVDPSALADMIVAELRRREPEREVLVQVAPELAVQGDGRLLRTVLENLLGNAWKFTTATRAGSNLGRPATMAARSSWCATAGSASI